MNTLRTDKKVSNSISNDKNVGINNHNEEVKYEYNNDGTEKVFKNILF
jgi:hypothetical protein